MKKLLSFFILYSACFSLCSPITIPFTRPFTIIGNATQTAFFVRDALGNNFVIKYHPRGPRRAIHDTLGAYIGKSINLNINTVEIFSPHDNFCKQLSTINPLRPSQYGVITLHTLVSGIQIKHIKHMNNEIWIKKGLYKEKQLKCICAYPHLCKIVAFDIFTDNTDRHNRNIFFDQKTEQFYLIDMDHGFQSVHGLVDSSFDAHINTLATRTYNFLKDLKKNKKLSYQETKALKKIGKTLQQLATLNPPELIFEEWMELAAKADFTYSLREQRKIRKYLEYNAQQIERLIDLLNQI